MFYLSLRSFLIRNFYLRRKYILFTVLIISTFQLSFIHASILQISFPPSSKNLSQYSLLPHYTHFHQQFIITFTHNYFQKDLYFDLRANFHPSITKHLPTTFNSSILSKLSQYANISFFLLLAIHSFINYNERRRRQRRKRRVNSVS